MADPRNATYKLIYHLARGNVPQVEIPQVLPTIFDARDYKYSVQQLSEQDLRMWVERLDQDLYRTASEKDSALPEKDMWVEESPTEFRGGAADVWRVTDDRKHVYAAKVFRANQEDDRKIKMYYKEVTVWKRLNHPNVVPTLGAGPDIAELCVVSPWMPDGDLLQYLSKYPGANRAAIMIGVADGLSHLHFNDVVHGDLKGLNILFDSAGVPRISDFGVSSITSNPISNNASTPFRPYSLRWAAPEILTAPNDESFRPTKMSDVYAFGMVVIEIFTGKYPFPDDTDINFQLLVMKGKRPPKPVGASKLGLSSVAWKLVEDCWNKRREKRPEIQYVASRLRRP